MSQDVTYRRDLYITISTSLNVKRRNWQSLRVLWGDSPGSLGHLVRHSLIKSQTFDIAWQYLTIDDFFDGRVLLFSTLVMSTQGWRFLLWSAHAKPSVSEDGFRPHPLVLRCHTTHVPRSWGFILFFRRCRAWQKHRTVRNGDNKNQSCQRVAKEFVGFWICLFMFVPTGNAIILWWFSFEAMFGILQDVQGFPVSLFPCFMFVRTFLLACLSSRYCTILIDFVRSCVTLCHPCCAPQQGM